MSDLRERGFHIARDLPELLEMVGHARAASDPHAFLHPGGLQWLLRRLGRRDTFAVLRWTEGDAVAGFGVDDGGYVMIQAASPGLDRHLALIDLAEARARQRGQAAIELSAWDDDRQLLAALAARGYEPSGTYGHELVRELVDEPSAPRLPTGFSMRWLEPELDDAYVELHRAAWSTRAPSDYDRQMHASVTSMPDFERELVPIVAAPDGTLAAYCIAWLDPRTQTVEIEPLGTHPEYRRLGLGRAIVQEVLRRSAARGAKSVMVWGAHQNLVAHHLYESSGLLSRRVLREYKRTLSDAP
jgi:ribosomal protein S18 acetylase RimI-like enzyme